MADEPGMQAIDGQVSSAWYIGIRYQNFARVAPAARKSSAGAISSAKISLRHLVGNSAYGYGEFL